MISLTNALNPGALDSSEYTHVKILEIKWQPAAKMIAVCCQHGYLDGSTFVPGVAVDGVTYKKVAVRNWIDESNNPVDDYNALMSKVTSSAGNPVCDEFCKELYQHLLDEKEYEGANTLA